MSTKNRYRALKFNDLPNKKKTHILNPAPQGRQNLLRGGTEKVFEAGEKIVSNLKMPNEMQNAVFLQIGGWDTDGETSRQSSQSRATCLHTVEWSVYYWEIRTNIN